MEVVASQVTSEEINSLFDTDLIAEPVNEADNQTKTDDYAKNLPREVYKSFRQAWNEQYGEESKPPTSDQMKMMYRAWITHPFDEDAWYQEYGDYYEGFIPTHMPENEVTEDQDMLVAWYCQYNSSAIDYTPFIQFVSKFVFNEQLVEITDINPFLLSSLPMRDKDELPEEAGIYFVIDESKIYYIGMSKNLQDRWYSHHRQDAFDKVPNLSIAYINSLPVNYLISIEKTLIQHFTPKLNIQHNPLLNNRS